jgi:hypothetical protein
VLPALPVADAPTLHAAQQFGAKEHFVQTVRVSVLLLGMSKSLAPTEALKAIAAAVAAWYVS